MRAARSAGLDADVRRLAATPPFAALPREALQLLAFSCEKRRLGAGETLFGAGDKADSAFFVLDGEMALRRGDAERRAPAGALIGESALLIETARAADAVAAADSLILKIPGAVFRRVLSEFPDEAAEIQRVAARRAQALVGKLEAIRRRAFLGSPAR